MHTLIDEKPTLIYCNLGSFGDRGPLRDQPGYDPLMQAFGGIMSITGEPERPPVRVGPSIIDMGAGMWCAVGILARADPARDRPGVRVDTSLFETALAWMTIPRRRLPGLGAEPGPYGHGNGSILAPYKAFKASDK